MKAYRVWVVVEEYDTETKEYTLNPEGSNPAGVGGDVYFEDKQTAMMVQNAVKIAGEVAISLPFVDVFEEDSVPMQGVPINTVHIPATRTIIPKYKEQQDEEMVRGSGSDHDTPIQGDGGDGEAGKEKSGDIPDGAPGTDS